MIQISACKNGDKEALGALYRAYAQKLLDICRHYVKEEEVAEDLLHDAFVVIFNSIGDLREETKIEGWMITIVRNLCLKYLQSVEHNLVSLSELSTEIQDEPYENKTPTIDLAQLLSAIDALPKGNREVFRLSVLDGLSHQEIGDLLGKFFFSTLPCEENVAGNADRLSGTAFAAHLVAVVFVFPHERKSSSFLRE